MINFELTEDEVDVIIRRRAFQKRVPSELEDKLNKLVACFIVWWEKNLWYALVLLIMGYFVGFGTP